MQKNSFSWMAGSLCATPVIKIKQKEYADFKRQWVFDSLRGYRYGQAFCIYFKVGDNIPIYWFKDNAIAEEWIQRNYLCE